MSRHTAISIGTLALALLACNAPFGSQPTAIATEQVAAPIVLESPIPVASPTDIAIDIPTEVPTATITPSPMPSLTVIDGRLASEHIDALLPTVNGERLYDTAFDLANFNSRNVNSDTIDDAADY